MVHGPWFMFMVHVSWLMCHDSWSYFHGSWSMVRVPRFIFMVHGPSSMVHGPWLMVHVYVSWLMVDDSRFLVHVSWFMFHGPWSIIPGSSSVVHVQGGFAMSQKCCGHVALSILLRPCRATWPRHGENLATWRAMSRNAGAMSHHSFRGAVYVYLS
jgi:hypothetical protein